MENNEKAVQGSAALHEGAAALARRCFEMAQVMITSSLGEGALSRGGRKGHALGASTPAGAAAGLPQE
jgi:hypothetical protein